MFRVYRELEQGEFIVAFADTSMGGLDYSCCQFLSKTKLDVPIVFHSKVTATDMTPRIHTELNEIYDITKVQPVIAYERNNGGAFEMERLARLNREGKYRIYQMRTAGTTKGAFQSNKLGWDTNSATRPKMLSDLKECIDNQLLRIYDKPTINEMFSFVVVQTSSSWKAQAEQGAHDDLIMSLAGAWQLYQTEEPREKLHRKKAPIKEYDPITGRLLT